jgi:hypothetical protein
MPARQDGGTMPGYGSNQQDIATKDRIINDNILHNG